MEKRKTYVLDTNTLLASPYCLLSFDEHFVVITDITLSELDNAKSKAGDIGFNAREVSRQLDELRYLGCLADGIMLPNGGILKVVSYYNEVVHKTSSNVYTADDKILAVCNHLKEKGDNPILVTNDTNLRIKANMCKLTVEEYKTDYPKGKPAYTGRRILSLPIMPDGSMVDYFYANHKLDSGFIEDFCAEDPLHPNEFLILQDEGNPSHSALAKYKNGEVIPLQFVDSRPWGIIAKNAGQRFALEALMDDDIPLVILAGPAGTGKTYLNMGVGLEKTMERHIYDKILIYRPMVYFDDGIGYLPGDEKEKISPMLRSYYDNLHILTRSTSGGKDGSGIHDYTQDLFDKGIVEAQAMTFVRGRSINDTWIAMDEAQNATPVQTFGVVTRAGVGTKIIMSGDPDQIDHPTMDKYGNGLSFTIERMKDSKLSAVVVFNDSECVRSPLALEAIARMSPKGYTK